jgi:hypothetical protein
MPAQPNAATFQSKLASFLDKWGLCGLASWDLPIPQGPLLPDELPPNSQARPSNAIHVVVPLHFHLQGEDDLIRLVQQLQREKAMDLDLDASLPGLMHHSAYGAMFEVIHLERTIRSRFPGRAPRGLVGAIVDTAATHLSVGVDHIRRLRKAVSACRKGRRSQISWLKIAEELPHAEILVGELTTFSTKITLAGNETFEAWRERDHDDMVLAVAMALWLGENAPRGRFDIY